MKHFSYILFIGTMLTMIVACQKPVNVGSSDDYNANNTTVIMSISLADTLSEKIVKELSLTNVTGNKIRSINGQERRYFQYEIKRDTLLQTIVKMPFEISNKVTDVSIREIQFETLIKENVLPQELSSFPSFWTAQDKDFKGYEIIKSGVKHQLLFHRHSQMVIHRVVYS